MTKKIVSLFILSIIAISNTFIIFQNSSFTPFYTRNEGNLEKNLPENDPITADNIVDYSKQGSDIQNPQDSVDFSQLYYKYKNNTIIQVNETIKYLISNLWDSSYKGFNDSDASEAKKRTYDNMLMIIKLLEYYDAKFKIEYITYAEEIFNFEYQYLWDNQEKLFLSYCDFNGDNPSALINSSDNILAISALLELYKVTANQTYLDIANLTYLAFDSVFYDVTNGGYIRSNLSGDTNKFAYNNLLISQYLAKIYQMGYFSSEIQNYALEKAENTLELLITHYLNGTYGFFSSGSNSWSNPNEEKSALINALAIDSLISVYEMNLNQTYLDIAADIADFIDFAFWDSNGINQGYNNTVSWDGSITLNSTKYLSVNSLIMEALLKLFEKSYNSTHYQNAIKISKFLNSYLWDFNNYGFNYSVDFSNPALNSNLKYTADNAWTIQALLGFRYPRPYLTRANTTMTYIYDYMYGDEGFEKLIMYDWSSLTSKIVTENPLLTFEDLYGSGISSRGNLLTIYTLLDLAEETQLNEYVLLANRTMVFLNQTIFNQAFIDNYSQEAEQDGQTYSTETNAWGILALLKLFNETGDTSFLEMANKSWYFIRDNLWDYDEFGYNTSTTENLTKDLGANIIMTWANLEIANFNHSILNGIRNDASLFANQTINIINQKMWNSTYYGYYSIASGNWTPIITNEIDKETYQNVIMILTLLKYNNLYPNNPNKALYGERINNTVKFLLNNLWDWDVGGFYLGCNEDGSYKDTNKYTYGNNWATLTFIELYKNTGNFSYYLLAEEINNFINTYLWDLEYGGYFHWCSQNGVPYTSGTSSGVNQILLISFKFIENQVTSILSLSKLSALKNNMIFPLIVDLDLKPARIDRGALELEITLKLIDIEGNPINQANISISRVGFYQTVAGENFYGFAERINLINQYGMNNFTNNLDISPFFRNFHLSISAFNSSMAVTWFFLSNNRSFDIYLSKAFTLLNILNFFLEDSLFKGYFSSNLGDNIKNAFDNWMAIFAILDYINGSGLNLLYNTSTYDLEQILTSNILNIFNFINDTLLYSPINETSIAFFSSINQYTFEINTSIFCRDTALAIITLLKYYQMTNNSNYLDMANRTWEFLNSTFWDTENLGYISVNGILGNQTKYLIDNIWAIMANLAIYNTTQINTTIRNSAMNMANLTLFRLIENTWDTEYLGFYSSFNGSTWIPFNTSISCKKTEVNALAIQMLLKFAELVNNPERENYINYANETFLFMNNSLRDKEFLGYFSSCNRTGTDFNKNKTLAENSLMILALIALYYANNYNYTYYKLAEETMFLIEQYFIDPSYVIYHSKSSQFGAINYDFDKYTPLECQSNFLYVRSLTKIDLERQKMSYPLIIDNIVVESPKLGEVQKMVNVTLDIFDSDGNPVENATVIGVIYGRYQTFSFIELINNTYYCIFNISNLGGTFDIYLLAFKEGYSAGKREYSFTRTFPIYIQKSYETLITLLSELWSGSDNIFYENETNYEYKTLSNFLAVEAFLDFAEIGGNVLWAFDWFANRTFTSYSELATRTLGNILSSSEIAVANKSISGYVSETQFKIPLNYTESATNAVAIITLLELYNKTGDSIYLELANNTWLYLNETFWDSTNFGYLHDNSTTSTYKSLYDNCLAILANLAINETLGINQTIRNQAFLLANETFNRINQSLWDNINGTYYFYSNNDWSNPQGRVAGGNALMILTLLRFYEHDQAQTDYLSMAQVTADLFIKYFYDSIYGGFITSLSDNLSLPTDCPVCSVKCLKCNAWAILALAELYNITLNTTSNYVAEDVMNFMNSYLANHYNSYLNIETGDINGYWDSSNRSGWVFEKTKYKYVGNLESTALIIKALLKLYLVANSTLPWINATVQILPSSNYSPGDFCNLTISVVDENATKITTTLNITMVGWKRVNEKSEQLIIRQLEYEYDSIAQVYKVKDINLTTVEDIFFCVYAKNTSNAIWWNVFYLHRTDTSLLLWGIGGDYIPSEDYWQYTIEEDVVIIEGLYLDNRASQGIPGATLNFTVYFPNETIWFSELVLTNSTGVGQFKFGPVPKIAELFGIYNVTLFASHANASISPKTWYTSTSNFIKINIDYGISILYFAPLEETSAQGDKIQFNVTIKHRMLANLSIDILIYSEGTLIPTLCSTNLTTGFNILLIETEVDERTPEGFYNIYINVSFENKVIRDTYTYITILSAVVIRDFYTPTWIAEDDIRYAVIEIEHRKVNENSNISVIIDCPALKQNPTIQIIPKNTYQKYYFALETKDNVPYGVYSGEIIVQRVNYTLDFEGEPLTFQIEIKPSLEVVKVQAPSKLLQNQRSAAVIEIQNNKESSITIKIVGYGDGFNNYEEIFFINPTEAKTINTPIIYYKNPWDAGLREYTIEIYYLNSSSEYSLISLNTFQINIIYSVNNILLGFVLLSIIIVIAVIWIFWYRDKKKRERKKLK